MYATWISLTYLRHLALFQIVCSVLSGTAGIVAQLAHAYTVVPLHGCMLAFMIVVCAVICLMMTKNKQNQPLSHVTCMCVLFVTLLCTGVSFMLWFRAAPIDYKGTYDIDPVWCFDRCRDTSAHHAEQFWNGWNEWSSWPSTNAHHTNIACNSTILRDQCHPNTAAIVADSLGLMACGAEMLIVSCGLLLVLIIIVKSDDGQIERRITVLLRTPAIHTSNGTTANDSSVWSAQRVGEGWEALSFGGTRTTTNGGRSNTQFRRPEPLFPDLNSSHSRPLTRHPHAPDYLPSDSELDGDQRPTPPTPAQPAPVLVMSTPRDTNTTLLV